LVIRVGVVQPVVAGVYLIVAYRRSQVGVLATMADSDEALYDRMPVLLKPPPLQLTAATTRVVVRAARKALPAAEAARQFTAHVVSPFLHTVEQACIKVRPPSPAVTEMTTPPF
jgi:hypothetical protein